jgi:hypothetical protein
VADLGPAVATGLGEAGEEDEVTSFLKQLLSRLRENQVPLPSSAHAQCGVPCSQSHSASHTCPIFEGPRTALVPCSAHTLSWRHRVHRTCVYFYCQPPRARP